MPRANIMALAQRVESARDTTESARNTLSELATYARSTAESTNADALDVWQAKRSTENIKRRVTDGLTLEELRSTMAAMMNTNTLQSVAREVEQNVGDGGMVLITIRVPQGFRDRVKAAAEAHGMDFSTYWRSLGWMFSADVKR